MDLYSQIFTRASTRSFDTTPLPADTLAQIEQFIASVEPLVPGVELKHSIVGPGDVKGMGLPKAPHYLLIGGKEHPQRNISAGFTYQHAELYMYSLGLATRWLGVARGKQRDPDHLLGMAFGRPDGPASRRHEDFKRKALSEIAQGDDPRLEAARLAPSGMNAQPWYFIVEGDAIHTYYKKSGGVASLVYSMSDLDLGIALCHLAVASEHEGKPFRFSVDAGSYPQPPQGFEYAGTVL